MLTEPVRNPQSAGILVSPLAPGAGRINRQLIRVNYPLARRRRVPGGAGPGDVASPRSSLLLGDAAWHGARVDRFQEDCERPAASDVSALSPSLAGDPGPLCRDGFSAAGRATLASGCPRGVPASPPPGSPSQVRGSLCCQGCPTMSQSDPHGLLGFSSPL